MKKAFAPILAALGAALTITTVALAEEEYDVTTHGSEITVTAKGHFHVNKEFPWGVILHADGRDQKIEKKFEFQGESAAKISGLAKGKYTLKGAVCNGPQCLPIRKDVEIK